MKTPVEDSSGRTTLWDGLIGGSDTVRTAPSSLPLSSSSLRLEYGYLWSSTDGTTAPHVCLAWTAAAGGRAGGTRMRTPAHLLVPVTICYSAAAEHIGLLRHTGAYSNCARVFCYFRCQFRSPTYTLSSSLSPACLPGHHA